MLRLRPVWPRRGIETVPSKIIIVAAGVMLAATAQARSARTSNHDIAWYVQHPAARQATLNLCRSDTRFSRDADCSNAHYAETQAWSDDLDRRVKSDTASSIHSPSYWASNRLARIGVMAACRNPNTGYDPATCAAARAGDALDPRGRN